MKTKGHAGRSMAFTGAPFQGCFARGLRKGEGGAKLGISVPPVKLPGASMSFHSQVVAQTTSECFLYSL